jgi:CelD/BcsL family acetyltransferase involved in cellulose biosynthesis
MVRAWAETCGAGCQPLFGLATDGEATVLLLWVVAAHRGRLMTRRVIEGVGEDLFGYHDAIVSNGDHIRWDAFWAAVRATTGRFGHQVLLRSVLPGRAGTDGEPAEPAPVLRLDGAESLDDLLARCSANHRGDVSRRLRRLNEQGPVVLRVSHPREAGADFDDLCAAYNERRDQRPEYPALDRPGLRELWRRVAVDGVAQRWGHLSVLTVSGEPVAWHLGLVDNGAMYWWVPAHARSWEHLSPGKALLAMLIGHALRSGYSALQLLTGAQPYKLAWRPDLPERRVIRWHSPTLVGAVLERHDRSIAR